MAPTVVVFPTTTLSLLWASSRGEGSACVCTCACVCRYMCACVKPHNIPGKGEETRMIELAWDRDITFLEKFKFELLYFRKRMGILRLKKQIKFSNSHKPLLGVQPRSRHGVVGRDRGSPKTEGSPSRGQDRNHCYRAKLRAVAARGWAR